MPRSSKAGKSHSGTLEVPKDRAAGQGGGRQPTQKKKRQHTPGQDQAASEDELARYKAQLAAGEYASFGRKEGLASRGKAGQEQDAASRNEGKVFDRLSHRDPAPSDPHCHAKHPDNWKWHKQSPGAPGLAARSRSNGSSLSGKPAASRPGARDADRSPVAQEDADGFKIKVIPTGGRRVL